MSEMSPLKHLKTVMLDLKGQFKAVCALANGASVKAFDWKNAVADALIFSTIGFFTTYASSLTVSGTPLDSLHIALVAFGLQFATFLGIKRGVVKQPE